MNLVKIDLKQFSSILCDFTITEDNSILYAKVSGAYRSGSEGNPDGLYIFSLLVAYYFVYEPISIILDLRDFEYTWGNTILKSLNFFNEIGRDTEEKNKVTIIIYSNKNKQAIETAMKNFIEGKRVLCENNNQALEIAVKNIEEYLGRG